MKKFWKEFRKIFYLFLFWRLLLFVFSYVSTIVIPKFGEWFPYADRVLRITGLPNWIWGFGNFDGVHYLRIAQNGYDYIPSQAFFPLYPILIRFFNILPKIPGLDTQIYVDPSYFITALILTNLIFLFAMFAFYKFVSLEFNKKIAFISLLFLLAFPTAFYFGAVYTESLFLLVVSASLFFLRRKKYILAGIFAALASATKVVGIMLFLLFLIELYFEYKKRILGKDLAKKMLGLVISPLGLISYMTYLKYQFADALYFVSAQPMFKAERSDKPFILLPQVLYRYARIFTNVPLFSHQFNIAVLEVVMSLAPLVFLVIYYKKIRFSYLIFTLGVLIIPTLTGTLTSMPRYALTAFLLIPYFVKFFPTITKWLIPIMAILQVVLLSLFIRGYWVA
jgi:Gpi18-like mannosyltransferase